MCAVFRLWEREQWGFPCDGLHKHLWPLGNFWGPSRNSLKGIKAAGWLCGVAEEAGVLAHISSPPTQVAAPWHPRCHLAPPCEGLPMGTNGNQCTDSSRHWLHLFLASCSPTLKTQIGPGTRMNSVLQGSLCFLSLLPFTGESNFPQGSACSLAASWLQGLLTYSFAPDSMVLSKGHR